MVPDLTHKANGQWYRYYVSSDLVRGGQADDVAVRRIPADEIERTVEREVQRRLPKDEASTWGRLTVGERWRKVEAAIRVITRR